jgi:hypothetical protein
LFDNIGVELTGRWFDLDDVGEVRGVGVLPVSEDGDEGCRPSEQLELDAILRSAPLDTGSVEQCRSQLSGDMNQQPLDLPQVACPSPDGSRELGGGFVGHWVGVGVVVSWV